MWLAIANLLNAMSLFNYNPGGSLEDTSPLQDQHCLVSPTRYFKSHLPRMPRKQPPGIHSSQAAPWAGKVFWPTPCQLTMQAAYWVGNGVLACCPWLSLASGPLGWQGVLACFLLLAPSERPTGLARIVWLAPCCFHLASGPLGWQAVPACSLCH